MNRLPQAVRAIILFVLALIVLFLPFTINDTIKLSKQVYYSAGYEKVKVKIDSVNIVSTRTTRGGASSDYVEAYNQELDIIVQIADNEKALLNARRWEDALEPHFHDYMKNHQDSILIWYHPNASAIYAKEEDRSFPLREKVSSLLINFPFAVIGLYAVGRLIIVTRKILSHIKRNK